MLRQLDRHIKSFEFIIRNSIDVALKEERNVEIHYEFIRISGEIINRFILSLFLFLPLSLVSISLLQKA